MPTTNDEAARIVEISKEYISFENLKQLFVRLDNEVGKSSENDSLKTSLKMMRLLVDPPLPPPTKWIWLAFYSLVSFHYAIVVGMTVAFCILPYQILSGSIPWATGLPAMVFIFFLTTSSFSCRSTEMENWLRKRLGKPEIKTFVKYYFIVPIRNLFKKSVK